MHEVIQMCARRPMPFGIRNVCITGRSTSLYEWYRRRRRRRQRHYVIDQVIIHKDHVYLHLQYIDERKGEGEKSTSVI